MAMDQNDNPGVTTAAEPAVTPRPRRARRANPMARGEPMVWLTGGCVAAAVFMILALLLWITGNGFSTFWPKEVVQVRLKDGRVFLGEPERTEQYVASGSGTNRQYAQRTLYKTGNYDLTGTDFTWVNTPDIAESARPQWAMIVERVAWQNAYGILEGITVDGQTISDPDKAWAKFTEVHGSIRGVVRNIEHIMSEEMGEVSRKQNKLRLSLREAELQHGVQSAAYRARAEEAAAQQRELEKTMEGLREQVRRLDTEASRARLLIRAADGVLIPADRKNVQVENGKQTVKPEHALLVSQVVRCYPANQQDFQQHAGIYLSRWREYLLDNPREANTEGGVWPAIVGTVMLTFIMVLVVVPVGVVAAIYLREYARQGLLLSIVRISVNNLAGVPSIVFGVFGLGFFCYGVGAFLDSGPTNPWPMRLWMAVLSITVAVLVPTAIGLGFLSARLLRKSGREANWRQRLLPAASAIVWLGAGVMACVLVAKMPFFKGFFWAEAAEGTPTLGKSAMLWASLTLALLTLPVVIVATEEALAAVPRSMREGSYACGASKWQTIQRIVLPRAMPGIMTGMVLAIARGAGEVAPLMLVGAVKLAPELPVSLSPDELFGINRSFMHLGFHIYDLGFQSRNAEAAKSMVYTTTFLLIAIVVLLNLAAMWIRTRLRKAYASGAF